MSESVMPGGWTDEEPVTQDVIQICLQLRKSILERISVSSDRFIPLTSRSQVVEGINYLVKVLIAGDECAHVLIFQALPCYGGKLTLQDVQYPRPFVGPLTTSEK